MFIFTQETKHLKQMRGDEARPEQVQTTSEFMTEFELGIIHQPMKQTFFSPY